ncbi:MAG: hypothetical protein II339_00045, partial [Spirochaetales bacterium]|nr:hypothetical protein [Spirochaetales bacterium]
DQVSPSHITFGRYINKVVVSVHLFQPKILPDPNKGTGPEKFKKPSAKRLKNRIDKKRLKSANEIARENKYR